MMYIYIYIYICIYVLYVYIYIYTYIYVHIQYLLLRIAPNLFDVLFACKSAKTLPNVSLLVYIDPQSIVK